MARLSEYLDEEHISKLETEKKRFTPDEVKLFKGLWVQQTADTPDADFIPGYRTLELKHSYGRSCTAIVFTRGYSFSLIELELEGLFADGDSALEHLRSRGDCQGSATCLHGRVQALILREADAARSLPLGDGTTLSAARSRSHLRHGLCDAGEGDGHQTGALGAPVALAASLCPRVGSIIDSNVAPPELRRVEPQEQVTLLPIHRRLSLRRGPANRGDVD